MVATTRLLKFNEGSFVYPWTPIELLEVNVSLKPEGETGVVSPQRPCRRGTSPFRGLTLLDPTPAAVALKWTGAR